LSYGLDYQFEVYGRNVADESTETLLLNNTATIPQSAWTYLTGRDSGEGFVHSITGIPTWDLLAYDVDCTLTVPLFVGFVFTDDEGDVVWLWNITTSTNEKDDESGAPAHVIDQYDDYSFAVQTMVPDAPLQKLSTKGEVLDTYLFDSSCGIVTHESRIIEDQFVFSFVEVV
jgi:hypothetical protein